MMSRGAAEESFAAPRLIRPRSYNPRPAGRGYTLSPLTRLKRCRSDPNVEILVAPVNDFQPNGVYPLAAKNKLNILSLIGV